MTNSPSCETKRILIIDDDADFADSLAVTISRSRPFEIEVENHSQLARTTALKFKPDLILLDIMMDRLSGPDLYFLFQRDEFLKKVPVVVVSGLVDENNKEA
ncbi:MAG: response regulator, partial [Verrucomicrobiota bacterium]